MDHSEAHVVMSDREHQGKAEDSAPFFAEVAKALIGTHEVLLTGLGLGRNQLRDWCTSHQTAVAACIVDSVTTDHPTDGQQGGRPVHDLSPANQHRERAEFGRAHAATIGAP